MNYGQVRNSARGILVSLALFANFEIASVQAPAKTTPHPQQARTASAIPIHSLFTRAFVIDDRLSVLRRGPSAQSEVIHRLRIGRPVYIIASRNEVAGQSRFCRVAVTRRTRGWIPEAALAVTGRTGEDQRTMKLIEATRDGLDRIVLCRLLVERFNQSPLVPRALMLIGAEAEHVAETLMQRARKRLADVGENSNASLRDYYLNDPGLDRYSKLRVAFDFNESIGEFIYDGKAYREVIKRFPKGEDAKLARQRLELTEQRVARRR